MKQTLQNAMKQTLLECLYSSGSLGRWRRYFVIACFEDSPSLGEGFLRLPQVAADTLNESKHHLYSPLCNLQDLLEITLLSLPLPQPLKDWVIFTQTGGSRPTSLTTAALF